VEQLTNANLNEVYFDCTQHLLEISEKWPEKGHGGRLSHSYALLLYTVCEFV
jgi:hypothetical protein